MSKSDHQQSLDFHYGEPNCNPRPQKAEPTDNLADFCRNLDSGIIDWERFFGNDLAGGGFRIFNQKEFKDALETLVQRRVLTTSAQTSFDVIGPDSSRYVSPTGMIHKVRSWIPFLYRGQNRVYFTKKPYARSFKQFIKSFTEKSSSGIRYEKYFAHIVHGDLQICEDS